MDVVLVGLPGSGKSAVGRRLAARHDAAFIDLDISIERVTGRTIAQIFEEDGEPAFRARERAAIEALGDPDLDPAVRRVIATGGGAPVDPRNRWRLYRRRVAVWLDGRPEVLAQRLRRSPNVRPLVAGRDPIGAMRGLSASRQRFYAAANRVLGLAEIGAVTEAVEGIVAAASRTATTGGAGGTILLRAETTIGTFLLGEGIAPGAVSRALGDLRARRAIILSEPGAWTAAGAALSGALARGGMPVERVLLPNGEPAKRLSAVETAAQELAQLRVERDEPLVVVGGGALGDAAGFVAATYLRGVPFIQVPTTLVAQIDSSIGGKTAVDLPEGKNLVGAFHQPVAIVCDLEYVRTLPERERRSALGEAVKMGALGDERLFELLESDGDSIARGEPAAFESGALAELVERTAWAKVEVVVADEREADGRISLNLGHSFGHAIEAAAGYRDLRHGEAVGYGLRGACRIGQGLGVTPPERAARIERVLDRLELGVAPLPYPVEAVLDALDADKKHTGGRLRWVLPTAAGWEVRGDVPRELVERTAASLLTARVRSAT
jgi:shikimate kinase / 3-dehydroquinate synthase